MTRLKTDKQNRGADIIAFVRESAGRPMKARELSRSMNVSADDYREFRDALKGLLKSGELVSLNRGRIGLPEQLDVLTGLVSVTRAGTGFLLMTDPDKEDIVIPSENLLTALDGDRVMVRREGFRRGREAGVVIKVLERARKKIVGVFHKTPHFNLVKPDDQRIHRDVYIPQGMTHSAKEGQKVVVKLAEWDDPYRNPEGAVVEILGAPGDPRVDLLAIVRSFDLTEEFPKEAERQARSARKLFTEKEIMRREDLRAQSVYTIDPADAKDHDDAVAVERTETGYRLFVHIADVSFFVREETLLDREAFARGTSVYLPGKVIPMLPEAISNDICSLREGDDRLAHSVIIDYDKTGKALDWRVSETVIRSRGKLSYEDAQSVIDGNPTDTAGSLRDEVLLAHELARKLSVRRSAAGSLDFDLPEARIELDETGAVVSLSSRVRLDSHRLVEEFMLEANKAVALTFSRLGLQTLYRVHDKPNIEKLESFALLASAFGYKFSVSDTISPKMVQGFLEQLKGSPEEEYLNELALRSMKKAVYQPENIGHFGLAFKHYLHFTSPIRRYPDLIVHRLLRSIKNKRYPHELDVNLKSSLKQIGERCSGAERTAERAEREAVKMLQASFLARHIGAEYDGIVSGVIARGIFVRMNGINSEGLVRVSSIDDDFYHVDVERHVMSGRRTGREFRLGDRVRVMVQQVDVQRREVDLVLVAGEDGDTKKRRKSPAGARGRGKRKAPESKAKPRTGGRGARTKNPKPKRKSRRRR